MRSFRTLFMFLGMLVVFELISQAAAAILIPPPPPTITRFDTELGWVYAGSRDQAELGYGDFELRFNSMGLRGPEVTGPVDLMILGNSVVMAQQVPEESTFAARMGAVNAGAEGYRTRQELTRFTRDLYVLEPAVLMLVVTPFDSAAGEPPRPLELSPDLGILNGSGVYRLLKWQHSEWAAAQFRGSRDAEYLQEAQTPRTAEEWDTWWGLVLDLRDAVPGEFVVVYSPPRSQVQAYQGGTPSFWMTDQIAAACVESGLSCFDLTDSLAGHDIAETYFDHIHYTERGHALVAQTLQDWLAGQR